MAPIASARAKSPLSDNNSEHQEKAGNNAPARVRVSASREKTPPLSGASAATKKAAEPAAKKVAEPALKKAPLPSSSSSSRPSLSAGSSSRASSASSSASSTTAKKSKPETTSGLHDRKERTKTPPAAIPESPELNANTVKTAKSHPLPSAALHKHKQASVFTSGKKKHKTNFGSAYDSGSIPCRINHGSIKNALHWTKEPATLDFNPLLITCVEGFQEVEHPFVFLARTAFKELMKSEDAGEKATAVLPQVIQPLRAALMHKDDDIFLTALEATRILSDAVEGEMNVYLPKLTQQIHRKLLTKQLRAEVEDTLATLERNGGKEALAIIRSKIPTYVSVSF